MDNNLGNYAFLNLDNLENPPFILLDIGVERRYQENYVFDNKNRPFYNGYILQYTLNGSGIYEYKGTAYRMEQTYGFFTSIPEDSIYYLPRETDDNYWEYLYLHFAGSAVDSFYNLYQRNFGPVFSISQESIPIQNFLNLHSSLSNGYNLKKFEGGELIFHFLTSLLRELEHPINQPHSDLVLRAIQHMEQEYATLSGIEAVATHLKISNAHLSRIFKHDMGISPIQYLINLRVQRALTMLLNSNLSIEEVAKKCGFSCGNYFSKVFRKYMGRSPEEYRRLI